MIRVFYPIIVGNRTLPRPAVVAALAWFSSVGRLAKDRPHPLLRSAIEHRSMGVLTNWNGFPAWGCRSLVGFLIIWHS